MMSANVRKVFVMAMVLVALASICVSIASAGGSTWYLRTDYTLNKVAPTDSSVSFNWWKSWSAGAAQCDTTLGAGTWTLYLHYTVPGTESAKFDLEVRNLDTGHLVASATDEGPISGSGTTSVNMVGTDRLFNKGNRLVLWIHWEGTEEDLQVNCGESKSTLTPPTDDPCFPVPELSTLALFSVGLLALVGYVVYRRRNI